MLHSPRPALAAAFVLVFLSLTACGPRYARIAVHEDKDLQVELRAEKRSGDRVDRGFSHPANISSVRIANILSRLDVRKQENDAAGAREAAIPTETLYDISGAVSKALARADSSQEVVVRSVRTSRRLGIFTDKHLTGLVVWAEGDQLIVSLTHVDKRIQKGPDAKLPEPWADRPSGGFRVVAGPSIVPVGANRVAVTWRDPMFRRAGNIRIGADGRVQRRTILLEEPPELAPDVSTPAAELPSLSPEVLRALADLEEQRRSGGISEAEYHRRRRELLAGEPASAP